MAGIRIPKGWEIPPRQATPEPLAMNRRKFLSRLAVAAAGTTGLLSPARSATAELYPAPRNPAYSLDRPLTAEAVVTRYNNFFEFSELKNEVWKLTDRFETRPWTLQVTGLVHKPQTFDLYRLIRRMPLEERLYRHRCVEAWSMAVPWTGFPFKALLDLVQPKIDARYVRFVSFFRPEQAPGQKKLPQHPWPHAAGLTLAEAANELSFLATGMYGHELPKQNGAPVRLVVPWKYGFKSLKSIVAVEFTRTRPRVLWDNKEVTDDALHFTANVDPQAAHEGRSQATETDIGTGAIRPTQLYNGYGPYVAHLYE